MKEEFYLRDDETSHAMANEDDWPGRTCRLIFQVSAGYSLMEESISGLNTLFSSKP
jgi:hypothetical protein